MPVTLTFNTCHFCLQPVHPDIPFTSGRTGRSPSQPTPAQEVYLIRNSGCTYIIKTSRGGGQTLLHHLFPPLTSYHSQSRNCKFSCPCYIRVTAVATRSVERQVKMWEISVGQEVRRQAHLGKTWVGESPAPSPDRMFKTTVLRPHPRLAEIRPRSRRTPCRPRRRFPASRDQSLGPPPAYRPLSWHRPGGKQSRRRSPPSAASAWGSSSSAPRGGRWCTCLPRWRSSRSLWSWWQNSGNKLAQRRKTQMGFKL